MNNVDQALEAASDAETQVKALIAEAAMAGDYGTLDRLVVAAKAIGEALKALGDDSISPTAPTSESTMSVAKSSAEVEKRKPRKKRKQYPKFVRSGNDLVKIGWSKKEKKEYQHKSPRSVLNALSGVLASGPADGTTTEQLLATTATDGRQIPSYQIYLCIAWLRHSGVIESIGRKSYRIVIADYSTNVLDCLFSELPESE